MTHPLLRQHAAAAGIHRVNLLGDFVLGATPQQMRDCNTRTLRCVNADPGFYSGFCYVNPSLDASCIRDEIDRCMAGGLCGIKLEVDVNARDARVAAVMQAAIDHHAPVLHHAWNKTGHGTQPVLNESSSADIAALAKAYPSVQIIMAHLAGVGERGVIDIIERPNVCVDTSGGPPVSGLVAFAVRHLGGGRVVYGSDFPIRNFASQVGRVVGAQLLPDARDAVLHGNARRLLRLPCA